MNLTLQNIVVVLGMVFVLSSLLAAAGEPPTFTGKRHCPIATRNPKPVVDFIVSCQAAVEPATSAAAKQLPVAPSPRLARDYRFDKTMSREVLENYLSRSISMEGLLNGRGDLDDNIRMLKTTSAKFIGRSLCLWGGEANLLRNLERAGRRGGDPGHLGR